MKKILFILFAISLFACEKDEKNKEPVKVKKLVAIYTEPDFFTLEGDARYIWDLKKAESFHPDYVFTHKDEDSTMMWVQNKVRSVVIETDYFEEKTPPHMSYWVVLNNSAFMAGGGADVNFNSYGCTLRNSSAYPKKVDPFIISIYANVDE